LICRGTRVKAGRGDATAFSSTETHLATKIKFTNFVKLGGKVGN
jgi:hypothetical protein